LIVFYSIVLKKMTKKPRFSFTAAALSNINIFADIFINLMANASRTVLHLPFVSVYELASPLPTTTSGAGICIVRGAG
jgi:hypothetical protein